MKEPGQMAFEAYRSRVKTLATMPWAACAEGRKADRAAVESAIRADERAKVIEECAKVAESHNWMRDIERWMNATQKEVSAVSAQEAAAAIRTLGEKKDG